MEIPGEAAEVPGEALELPPERRSAFLDKACHGSPQLREVVEQLLLAEQNAGSFLEQPAFAPEGVSELPATVLLSADARFQPAQLIANRFRVVRYCPWRHGRSLQGKISSTGRERCSENDPPGNRHRRGKLLPL